MAVTLQEIAAQSGVSIPTVSRILRGEVQRHRPETCQRVLAVAQRLDYRPNFLSRALLSGKTKSVGLLAHAGSSRRMGTRIRAFNLRARDHGYMVYTMMTHRRDRDGDQVKKVVQDLLDRRVDGIVVQRSVPLDRHLWQQLETLTIPVVYIGWGPAESKGRIIIDHQPAIDALAEHLVNHGHRRVAFFCGAHGKDYLGHKVLPYQHAFAKCGAELISKSTGSDDEPEEIEQRAYDTVFDFLHRRQGVTALLMNNDESAVGALAAARTAGLRVPEDVSIAGFDDLALTRMVDPPLTSIRVASQKVGEAAFEMLHKLMTDASADIEPVRYPSKLVVRSSTGPAPGRSVPVRADVRVYVHE